MKKIRLGVVGLGHRGREMYKLAAQGFDCIVPAAACDIKAVNWYETQWLSDAPMAEMFPETVFYEDYDKMLEEAELDAVLVETGTDPVKAGLAMTLPGIYAEESARRGGEVLRMRYPWDPDWTTDISADSNAASLK